MHSGLPAEGDPRAALLALLGARQVLLVLDNCEHVNAAAVTREHTERATHDRLAAILAERMDPSERAAHFDAGAALALRDAIAEAVRSQAANCTSPTVRAAVASPAPARDHRCEPAAV